MELLSTVLCSVCLSISLAISIFCVFGWVRYLRRKNKGILTVERNKTVIKPFFAMVLGVFIAAMVMFIPIYLNDLENPTNWATYIKIPLLSAHNALRLFVVDADFGNVRDIIGNMPIANALQGLYTVVFACYFVIAPLLTGAFVLSLIKGLYESWRYKHSRPTKLYIMSELNENSLALAKDILQNYAYRDEDILTPEEIEYSLDISEKRGVSDRKIKRTLVFANVTSQFEQDNEELVEKARKIGAICLGKEVTEISLKTKQKDIVRKLYFIGLNEDENVTQATQMIKICNSQPNCNSQNTHIYVFAISEESGVVLDSCILNERKVAAQREYDCNNNEQNADNGNKTPLELYPAAFKINVRRIDETRNLVWSTLLKTAEQLNEQVAERGTQQTAANANAVDVNEDVPYLFKSACKYKPQDAVKRINVLIVGLGGYGSELLKTICWLSQMPGYVLHAYVFDSNPNAQDRFRAVCPELVDKRADIDAEPTDFASTPIYGDAYYGIKFYNGVDVNAASFMEKIESISERITLAFVTLGDDSVNIDTSLKLRRYFGKMYGDDVPLIVTAVYSSDKTKSLNKGHILVSDKGQDYRIRFIGDTASRYSLANIQQTRLESIGEACHMQWAAMYNADSLSWAKNLALYNYVEYNNITSMAQAMYLIARKEVIKKSDSEPSPQTLAIYEHRRWNAFMRVLGYRVVPMATNDQGQEKVVKNNLIRVHSSLVPYDDLPQGEQAKDDKNMDDIIKLVRNHEKYFAEQLQQHSDTKQK